MAQGPPHDSPPPAGGAAQAAPDANPRRGAASSPAARIGQGVLSLLLVYLIFAALIPSFADYSQVWDSITAMTGAQIAVQLCLFAVIEVLKGTGQALPIPGLRVRQSLVAAESATAVSNTIPGPSGTATKFAIYRSWGFNSADFARGWLLSSAFNNGVILAAPIIAVLLLAANGEADKTAIIVALIGLAVAIVGLVLAVLALRREAFARRLGRIAGRIIRWARGVAKRPPTERDFVEVAAAFRLEVLSVLKTRAWALGLVILSQYVVTGILFAVSIRACGVPASAVNGIDAFAVYAAVRLLSVIEVTPGGAGVTEALYITGLAIVSDNTYSNECVAGVLVFRFITYLLPIVLGAFCYVIWRLKKSWRRAVSDVDQHLDVVSVVVERPVA